MARGEMFTNTNPAGGIAGINVELNEDEIRGIRAGQRWGGGADWQHALPDITVNPIAKAMAFGARDGLAWILTKGYMVGGSTVGATNRSAASMQVAEMGESPFGNGRGYAVYEGADYTKYIRTGTPPQAKPPIGAIKAWIVAKGMGSFEANAPPSADSIRGSAMEYVRRQRSHEDALTRLARRISFGIAKKGTSTQHKPMHPGGQRRFDYVDYAVRKLRMLDQLYAALVTKFPYINHVLVGYLRTGKWNKDSVFNRIRLKSFKPR